ncbi:RNA binding protein Pym, putative [Talaromyces stipitatus ATCC 10500]|uniref:RNA binding protein Pym, putative n=1 Tax=Talaromyces stipitatus (strain ATCC 10500 / CBS 375.48 / QM 6759 / NRRL 1006) TaxID=441959 RepID=B8M1L0_TALSN|nr:RNA binding protein Pym, putative [Talaromyces stipitatus ATCC 10500]EED22097.1 RNA binding protein Pym, putative [Talaromyces stipitatus ATCC 10500]
MISDVQKTAKKVRGESAMVRQVDECCQVNIARIEVEVPLGQTASRKPENFRLAYWPMVAAASSFDDLTPDSTLPTTYTGKPRSHYSKYIPASPIPNKFKMPATEPVSSSGIVVDQVTGRRHVPSSTRADGTKRKEIRIRPGYQPPEDVKKYKNPSAEAWKNRGSGGVPGAEPVSGSNNSASAASNKNAKRREARKKAKAEEEAGANGGKDKDTTTAAEKKDVTKEEAVLDPEAEKEKKARNLKKKLRQARELSEKKDKGESLLPEQFAKVIKINELIRELDALGFDADGEKKKADV